eukprot:5276443-Amphidinium_carterae.2
MKQNDKHSMYRHCWILIVGFVVFKCGHMVLNFWSRCGVCALHRCVRHERPSDLNNTTRSGALAA